MPPLSTPEERRGEAIGGGGGGGGGGRPGGGGGGGRPGGGGGPGGRGARGIGGEKVEPGDTVEGGTFVPSSGDRSSDDGSLGKSHEVALGFLGSIWVFDVAS